MEVLGGAVGFGLGELMVSGLPGPGYPTPQPPTPEGQGEQRSAEEGWNLGGGWHLLGASLSRPDPASLMPARCAHDGSWEWAAVGKPSRCVRLSRC